MHLAVLMTNTDESAFAQKHPKDGEKFESLIKSVRPDWQVTSFAVKDGEFPADPAVFDGLMITGSPASVLDGADWIAKLEALVRQCHSAGQPIFGACFGHQVIATALGGTIGDNPNGWVFGVAEAEIIAKPEWSAPLGNTLKQYAAHIEQVVEAPKGAIILTRSKDCSVGGFAIGRTIYTTQNHPEMSHSFMTALVKEYAPKLPYDVAERAGASLIKTADTAVYAETIARFFEQAQE